MLIFNTSFDKISVPPDNLNTSHVNLQLSKSSSAFFLSVNLNTSHVNLQRMEVVFPCPGSPNLNTSHVNLQPVSVMTAGSTICDLNTSHVNLQPWRDKYRLFSPQRFKYISC